ncbi:LysR family transcriptional regulator [Schlegelella sp. S2-27]|uniref:LysR family transcriptional regulator n=1 Tax=Caldimonas mangrovi TaxID=2944811 RepID=A0ABT0YVF8_9BURK|nr:LysR family transcriptional regulator [Caldimonas mangrovi]
MSTPDLNLLVTLNVLLSEGSVAAAARRLRLSPSAMSRALARLRATTGDPLLVRAGRALVPTPRALELRERVRLLVDEAEAALRPATRPDLGQLARTFTVRASEGYAETFGPGLIARLAGEAPRVQLRFVTKTDKEGRLLREGAVDLEIGVVAGTESPELRVQALFPDRFVGVVRAGHPLCKRDVTPQAYAAAMHVATERRGGRRGPVDTALRALGLELRVATTVGGFATALALARGTDLVATVPERHTHALRTGLHSFALPFATHDVTVSMLWHPRLHADPAHRWLRQCVRDVCTVGLG